MWNLAAFILMGITGVILNLAIGRFYGPGALGIFNQVLSIYIVLSQFAVLGIWLSVLKHTAEFAEDKERQASALIAALLLSGFLAGCVTLFGYLMADWFGSLLQSQGVATGWLMVLPGFWCYCVNKIFLAFLNGRRDMRAFAISQASRYILMIAGIAACIVLKTEPSHLAIVISWPEIPILLGLIIYTRPALKVLHLEKWLPWLKIHLLFGLKSFLSGTMAELNTRIDVIMLGYFAPDEKVGIYSMAAMVAEGISQLSIVLRDNINPLITNYYTNQKLEELSGLIKKSIRGFYAVMGVILLFALLLYPYVINFLTGGEDFHKSWGVFAILGGGIALSAGYLPVNMILVQMGFPGTHTTLKSWVVITNFSLNLVLIPLLGMYGAALATATTYVCAILYLKILTKKSAGITI